MILLLYLLAWIHEEYIQDIPELNVHWSQMLHTFVAEPLASICDTLPAQSIHMWLAYQNNNTSPENCYVHMLLLSK